MEHDGRYWAQFLNQNGFSLALVIHLLKGTIKYPCQIPKARLEVKFDFGKN